MKTLNRILIGAWLVMLTVFGIGSCMKYEARPCGNCGDKWLYHKYVHHLGGKVCPQDLGCFYGHENPPCTIHLFEEVNEKPLEEYDYQMELNRDGSIDIHTYYGEDVHLEGVEELEEFIINDNL